ncbi:aminotransferase class V-fold PLP-dependent enzyme [Leifsonia poae]|uniref:aminotransferase class V-fold PLP-dependent enzyme n=1 Tax=Leifsonia poae TaxID=110933 RepID=UPI001CBD79BA|nr:aminotransferase class V-fold PLP-dependent enzyme [Leifsonia poae]
MPTQILSPRHGADLDAAREQFHAPAGYLAACTQGLPVRATLAASRAELDAWERAETTPALYSEAVDRARSAYARLVKVTASEVAIGSQVSVLVSLVAASAPDGAEIVCVDGDFSSMVAPFIAQAHRGITVVHAPLEHLAEAIGPRTWLVAFSLVQSATGEVANTAAVLATARRHGARTLADLTQAAGWLPVEASAFDATVCHAYKWLCAPRGSAFLTVGQRMLGDLNPTQAGWFAGDDPWASCYGPEIRLATDARRFDVSPAWPVWPGTAAALEFFASLDPVAVRDHDAGLGDELCARLGLPAHGQAIVTWPDRAGADLAALTAAGLCASGRAGRVRVAFHLWNTASDVDAITAAIETGIPRGTTMTLRNRGA